MEKWIISKQFDFCFGHRVWRQVLDKDLSCNSKCKCRHFHGHQGTVLIYLEGSELDDRGMFLDFNDLNWFKKWIDDILDHKMILDINDPALKSFFPLIDWIDFPSNPDTVDMVCNHHSEGYFTIKLDSSILEHDREVYEGLVLVPFVPTSENLSKWLWQLVNEKIGHLCKVSRVQFFETPKSQSNYYSI